MKIAIIGAGAMGGALAQGLIRGTVFAPQDVIVANPHADKLRHLADMGATTTTDNRLAVADADFIALVVKPWLVQPVIEEIKSGLDYSRQSILNMAASVPSEQLFKWLDKGTEKPCLHQVIPNTAIAVKSSMTFIAPCHATPRQTEAVAAIFNDLGKAMIVDEQLLPAGTMMAGCGIAYAMRYIRAAAEGGVELGFKADVAKDIVLQTVKGAVDLLLQTGSHPEAEIDKVTTPGGLTIKGLNAMEHAGFTSSVIRGLKAGLQ